MLRKRFGYFLFVVGVLVLIVFIGSVMVDNPQSAPLLIGLILIAWGVSWMRKGAEAPEASNRFGLVHRLNRRDQNPQDKG